MGEYIEDGDHIEDLLGGEDDDGDVCRTQRRGFEDLMEAGDIDAGQEAEELAHKERLDRDLIDVDIGLDEIEESEEEKEEEVKEQKQSMTSHLETPPGLNLFTRFGPDPDNQSYGFKHFTLETLNLEQDFGYSRRGKLKGHGYTDDTIDQILSDRLTFVRHLMPEAQSLLLCDKDDYKAIMDFLFYSISVCTERRLNEFLIKAFFDLAKNYGFTWRLGIKHIVTVLLNYGIQPSFVDVKWFQKHLLDHMAVAKSDIGKGVTSYKFGLPRFWTERVKHSTAPPTMVEDGKFNFAVSKFVLFVCEFCNGVNKLDFRRRGDWGDLAVFLFLFIQLGTAQQFILDYRVYGAISTMLLFQLDSIPTEYWWFGPTKKKTEKLEFNKDSFPRCLSIMIHAFFPGERSLDILLWTPECEKLREHEHRLNIIHKLEIIPPSYRGNQVRRFLAYLYLQSSLVKTIIKLPLNPGIQDIANSTEILDATYLKILLHKTNPNYPMLLVIIKLCDMIVGNETHEAFLPEKVPAIRKVQLNLLNVLEKKFLTLPTAQKMKLAVPMVQLKNYVQIVNERWEAGCAAVQSS